MVPAAAPMLAITLIRPPQRRQRSISKAFSRVRPHGCLLAI